VKPAGDVFVLSVGVYDYDDPALTKPRYADADAEMFGKLWEQKGSSGRVSILLNRQATRGAMRKAIEERLGAASRDDTVLLFFAGHGESWTDSAGQTKSGLLLQDTSKGQYEEYYAFDDLLADLHTHVKAKNLLLILDCCHSGAAGTIRSGETSTPLSLSSLDRKIGSRGIFMGYSFGLST
jgi:hypothetical protein